MEIIRVDSEVFPEIKIITYGRHSDKRGFFSETFRQSDFYRYPSLAFVKKSNLFTQTNSSYSVKRVIRGLHFQWNPYMGKMVRTMYGRMIDLFLDIRIGSPTFGKIGGYEMVSSITYNQNQWIWIPEGFAHGGFFTEKTLIEYFCTSEYNQKCEASISPLAPDIDWSLCNKKIKQEFDKINKKGFIISNKDKLGLTVKQWSQDMRSKNFLYK